MTVRRIAYGLVLVLAGVSAFALTKARPTYTAATIERRITERTADGKTTEVATETEYRDALGNWRVVRRLANGHQLQFGADTAGGQWLSKDDKRYVRTGDYAVTDDWTAAAALRKTAGFVRDDTILGQPAVVLHPLGAGGAIDGNTEVWVAPALGRVTLRMITTMSNGGQQVIEPTSITVGEPLNGAARLPAHLALYTGPPGEL
ncbi:MAG TPA: hypothetical protein VF546_08990 [Pyrinomonadaceae bacterium]|jgi:hypothetical protein